MRLTQALFSGILFSEDLRTGEAEEEVEGGKEDEEEEEENEPAGDDLEDDDEEDEEEGRFTFNSLPPGLPSCPTDLAT